MQKIRHSPAGTGNKEHTGRSSAVEFPLALLAYEYKDINTLRSDRTYIFIALYPRGCKASYCEPNGELREKEKGGREERKGTFTE